MGLVITKERNISRLLGKPYSHIPRLRVPWALYCAATSEVDNDLWVPLATSHQVWDLRCSFRVSEEVACDSTNRPRESFA